MEYSQDMENSVNQLSEGSLDPAELAILEKKIESLVEYCTSLREENRQLKETIEERDSEIDELKARLADYDAMRNDVRLRISRLVRTIEDLEADSGEADGSAQPEGQDESSESSVSQPELLPSDSQEV